MRKILSVLFLLSAAFCASAAKIAFYTGLSLGSTPDMPINVDPYIPANYALSGGSASVTSIEKTSGDVWKMRVTVVPKDNAFPVNYDYFLKPGGTIYMRRVVQPRVTYSLKVVSVDWNKAVFEVE